MPTLLAAGAAPGRADAPRSLDAYRAARFQRRGRVLFGVRCAIGAGLALASLEPSLARSLGLENGGLLLLAGFALSAVASRLLLPGPMGRAATLLSLCLDAACLTRLLVATGGLFSPLVGNQPILLAGTAALFPGRLPLLPAFLVLPVAAGLFGPGPIPAADLFLLGWYAALDLLVVVSIRWLQERDEAAELAAAALAETRRAAAVLEERARLSREIHDGVGASLSTLVLQAELASTRVVEAVAAAEVAALRTTAEEAIEELRRSIRMLRDELDPGRATEEHCQRFAARTGLAVRCSVQGGGTRLGSQAQLTLFRVLQEALQNVARHARARSVEVELHLEASGARLIVRDDGIGFDAGDTPAVGHYGLRGMRERALHCGGSLSLRSTPGAGTTVELLLPAPGEER